VNADGTNTFTVGAGTQSYLKLCSAARLQAALEGLIDTVSAAPPQGTPAPCGPPAAGTLPATGLTTDGARLAGHVATNGQPAAARFEYGTTSSYGASTPDQAVGADTDIGADLSGLQPGTTYHYRLVVARRGVHTVGPRVTTVHLKTTIRRPRRHAKVLIRAVAADGRVAGLPPLSI